MSNQLLVLLGSMSRTFEAVDTGNNMCDDNQHQLKRKFCQYCNSWLAKTSYYDHLPCEESSSSGEVKGENRVNTILQCILLLIE